MYDFGARLTHYFMLAGVSHTQSDPSIGKDENPRLDGGFGQALEEALAWLETFSRDGTPTIDDDPDGGDEHPQLDLASFQNTELAAGQSHWVTLANLIASDSSHTIDIDRVRPQILPLGMHQSGKFSSKDEPDPEEVPRPELGSHPVDRLRSVQNSSLQFGNRTGSNQPSSPPSSLTQEREIQNVARHNFSVSDGPQNSIITIVRAHEGRGSGAKTPSRSFNINSTTSMSSQNEGAILGDSSQERFAFKLNPTQIPWAAELNRETSGFSRSVSQEMAQASSGDEGVLDFKGPKGLSEASNVLLGGDNTGGKEKESTGYLSSQSFEPAGVPTISSESSVETFFAQIEEPPHESFRAERLNSVDTQGTTASLRDQVTEAFKESLQSMIRGIARDSQGEVHGLRLRLYPESLGDLDLRIAVEKGVLNAHFLTQSEHVRALIEAALPDLRDQLSQQGISVEDLSVAVGDGESSGQDGLAHERTDERATGAIPQQDDGAATMVTSIDGDEYGELTHGRVDVLV